MGLSRARKKKLEKMLFEKRIKCKAQNQKRAKERCVSFKFHFYLAKIFNRLEKKHTLSERFQYLSCSWEVTAEGPENQARPVSATK